MIVYPVPLGGVNGLPFAPICEVWTRARPGFQERSQRRKSKNCATKMLTLQLNRLSPLVRNGYKSYIAPVASMRSWELTVASNDLFSDCARNYEARRQTEMTLEDYLR